MESKGKAVGSVDSLLEWPDNLLFGRPLTTEELRTAAGPPIEDVESAKEAMSRVAKRCSSFVKGENARASKVNLDYTINAINVVEFFLNEYDKKDDILGAFISKRKYIEPYVDILTDDINTFFLNFREMFAITNFLVKLVFPFCFTDFGPSFRTTSGLANLYTYFAPISIYVLETGPGKQHQKEQIDARAYEYGLTNLRGKTLYEIASILFKNGYTGESHREAIRVSRSYLLSFESEDDLNTLVANIIFISLVYFTEIWEVFLTRQEEMVKFFNKVKDKKLIFRIIAIMFALKETAIIGGKSLDAFDVSEYLRSRPGDVGAVTDLFDLFKLVASRSANILGEYIVSKCLVEFADIDNLNEPQWKVIRKNFFVIMNNTKNIVSLNSNKMTEFIFGIIEREETKFPVITKKLSFYLKVLNYLMEKKINDVIPGLYAQLKVPKIEFTPERMSSLSYVKFLVNVKVSIPLEAFNLFSPKINIVKKALKILRLYMEVPEAIIMFDKVIESMVLALEPSNGKELFDVLRSLLEHNPLLQDRVIDVLDKALSDNDYKKRIKIVDRVSWVIDGLYPEKDVLEKIIEYKKAKIVKDFFGDVVSKKAISKEKFAHTFKVLLLIDSGDRIIPFIRVLFCAKPVPEDRAYLFKILSIRADLILSHQACVDVIMDVYANSADPSNKPMLEVAHDFLAETKNEKYTKEIIELIEKLMDKLLELDEASSSSTILAFAESFLDSIYWLSLKNANVGKYIFTTMSNKLMDAFKKLVRVFKTAMAENPAAVKAAAVPLGRIYEPFIRDNASVDMDNCNAEYLTLVRETIGSLWSTPGLMIMLPKHLQVVITYNRICHFMDKMYKNLDNTLIKDIFDNHLPLAVHNEDVWTLFHGVLCKFQEFRPENAELCFGVIRDKILSVAETLAGNNEEECAKALSYMNACVFYFSSTLVYIDKYGMTLNKINITETLKMLARVLDIVLSNECAKKVLSNNRDAQSDLLDIASSISTSVTVVAVGQGEPSIPSIASIKNMDSFDDLMKSSVFPFFNPHVTNEAIMDVICSMIPALEYVGSDKKLLLDKIVDLVEFVHIVDIPHLEKHLDNIISVLARCASDDKSTSCYDIIVILLTLLMWQPEDDAFNFTYRIRKNYVEKDNAFDLFGCYNEYLPFKKNDLRVLFLATKYSIVLSKEQNKYVLNPNIDVDRILLLSDDGINSEDFKTKMFIFEKLKGIISDKEDKRSEFASMVLISLVLRVPVLQYYICTKYPDTAVVDAFMDFFQHRGISFELEECSKYLSRYTMGTVFLQRLLAKVYCTLLDNFLSVNENKVILTANSIPLYLLSLSEVLSVFIHVVKDPVEKASVIKILLNGKVLQKLCSGIIGRLDFAHFKEQPQKDPVSTIFVLLFAIIQAMSPMTEDDKFVIRWDVNLKSQERELRDRIANVLMRLMTQSESPRENIEPTSFDGFTTWINNNMENNSDEPNSQFPPLRKRLCAMPDNDEWKMDQDARILEMNEEFSCVTMEPPKYELQFDCNFKNAIDADIKKIYGELFSMYEFKQKRIYDPNCKRENPELDMDIAVIISELDRETQELILQARGENIAKSLLKHACNALGLESGSSRKIDGVETNISVAATALSAQNVFSSPEVVVPLLKMLYCTDECFPAELVENILSLISRIPSMSTVIFDLIVLLLFVSFKACEKVTEEERQGLIYEFLHRTGARVASFADNPLFKSLLNARAVITDGYIVFKSVSESGNVAVYGDVCEGIPDLTSKSVARLFTNLRSMIMDKDKGVPISQKQFTTFLGVMGVTLSKFFNTLSIEVRARIVAFISALTSYVDANYDSMFDMPQAAIECLVEIVPRIDILPELSSAYLSVLKCISKNDTVRSFMEKAFYDDCSSTTEDIIIELKKYNGCLNDILKSEKEYETKDLVSSISNLKIGSKLSKLLSAINTIYLSKKNAKDRTDTEEFLYELTDPAKALVDKIMPFLEESLVLLNKLSSKEVGWPKGSMGNVCFRNSIDSISSMITVVLNRLVINVKSFYEVGDDNSDDVEEFIFEDNNEQSNDVEMEESENEKNKDGNEEGEVNNDEKMDDNEEGVKNDEKMVNNEEEEMNNDEKMVDNEDDDDDNVEIKEGKEAEYGNENETKKDVEIEIEDEYEPNEKSNTFEEFYIKHSNVITKALKVDPSFIIRAFYPFMYVMPGVIDFESKQWWFNKEIKILKKGFSKDKTEIKIRRDNILNDSFAEFFKKYKNLKSPIKVVFEGEEASDAGGPRREWYQEISRSIADPNFGLFTLADNGAIQPNPLSGSLNPHHLNYFKFIGLVVGKALWDGETIDLHFTHSFYKRILSRPIAIHDMEAKDHVYYESLMSILNTPGAEDLGLDFTVQLNDSGISRVVPLIPGGENIEVNDQNKKKYVELVINFELVKSTMEQTREFLNGFREFIPKRLIKPFTETQLEILISGMPVIDVEDLRKHTVYCNGYTPTSDVVTWFWRAVESYSGEEKAMLLQFITGSGKAPAGGFGSLALTNSGPIKVSRYGSTDRLPTTRTCFNQIEIPPYESYEILYEKLTMAIYCGYKGFGFI